MDEAAQEMKLLRTVKMDGGCFVAGTLVHTKVGLKPVETIKVGDWVLSQPEEQGERVYRQVTNTFALGEKVIWLVGYYVVDPSMIEGGALEYVAVTGNHPFWVKDAGWTRADELYRDSKIEFHNGTHGYVLASRPLYRTHEANKAWVQGAHGIVANDWSGDFVCFDGGEICVTVDNISAPDIAYLLKFRSWFFYLKALIYNEKGVLKGYNIG
jgi:hypothetical protein